jgi:hypothetical protein
VRIVVDTRLTLATGTAERQAALEMVADRPGNHRITLGAHKAYDVTEFVADLRAQCDTGAGAAPGAHTRSNHRELLPMERRNNDQHALRQRASTLQRGRAGG